MERHLASIQKIVSLTAIPGADVIEKATVLGWEVIVAKKDNLKVGDLVCYMEVDSILPDKPEFEFLRERKFRIRTIKLRGQISQGIVFPLDILKNYGKLIKNKDGNIIGIDV
jgi:RNA ligase (TIGR02306 family)